MTRTVVVTFEDGSSHTYANVPEDVTREEVRVRAAREFSAKAIAKIDRLAPGAGPGEIPTAPTAAQAAAGATAPVAPPAVAPPALPQAGAVRGLADAASTLATAPAGLVVGAGRALGTLAGAIMSGQFGTKEAADAVEAAMAEGMQSATYAPRTAEGQAIVGAIGEAGQALTPILPLTGPASQLATLAAPAARQAAAAAAPVVAAGARGVANAATRTVAALRPAERAGDAAGGSVGASGVLLSELRQSMANELPIPPQLTRGQRARTYAEQQAEQMLASDAKFGDPIRQRYNDQRQQLVQSLDAFIDSTASELTDLRDVGVAVDKTLRGELAKAKTRTRVLYKEAEKAGELGAPVTLEGVAQFFNDNTAEAQVANVIGAARQKALNLGLIAEGPDGKVIAQPTTLKQGELFRRSVGNLTNAEPTNIKFAAELKRIYDEGTAGSEAAAPLYAKARAARRQMAEQFELNELTRNLIGNKRGTADRAVAFEDVLRRTVLTPGTSLDSLRHVGQIIKKSGPEGQQTWRELQGATIRHLQERALSNVARDERGTPIFSVAKFDTELKALDRSGKLEYLFGKRGAEQLRTLNDVAKVVFNPLPGTVNTSNTATTLAAMIDLFTAAGTGVPMPAVTGFKLIRDQIKDRKLRARVAAQLN